MAKGFFYIVDNNQIRQSENQNIFNLKIKQKREEKEEEKKKKK